MNFLQDLMRAPVVADAKKPAKEDRLRAANKRKQAKVDGRYRLFLEGVRRTTNEIKAKMGTQNVAKKLAELERRGLVKRVGSAQNPKGGRPQAVWTWA